MGNYPGGVGSVERRPSLELDSIPALFALAAEIELVGFGNADGFNQRGPEALAGAAGGVIVGIARDPDRREPMTAREGEQQANSALGEMVAPGGGEHVVTDVAAVHVNVVVVT